MRLNKFLFNAAIIIIAYQELSTHSWKLNNFSNKATIPFKVPFKQLAAAIIVACTLSTQLVSADSRLNAPTAAGTRVNSDAESLLRYGLPIDNKDVRNIQSALESAKLNLKTRRTIFAKNDIQNMESLWIKRGANIIQSVPSNHKVDAEKVLIDIKQEIPVLLSAIEAELAAGAGSLQERKGLDDAYAAQNYISRKLSLFEELLVPDEYGRTIPKEYERLPALTRRAEVEMVIKKQDGSQYDVDGKLYDFVKIRMVIDGFNAPLTGGNFIDLVSNGFYNGLKISRADGFVVQTGDPHPEDSDNPIHGYIPLGSKTVRTIPLEIAIKGDKEILYGLTTEDDSRGYAATILPFQSYGALGMARSEFEPDSASSQFFFLLFESDLTPAGKNMLDGRYACFGYTVDNADLLKDVKEGDIIQSAKVIRGIENFIKPKVESASSSEGGILLMS